MQDVRVIAPNLKRRLSGVTATIARLVPLQAQWIDIAATGPGLPRDIPHIPLAGLPFLSRGPLRVWHARRNTEMLLGLILRHVFRLRLKLLFTSASQRSHSGYTKRLISRMDAVVATSRKTAGYLDRDADVIMHGIDLQGFTPPEDKPTLRRQLDLPEGLLLGCYGRIRHQKGTDAFVEAMIGLCESRPDVSGIVMGRATDSHSAFLEGLKARVDEAGMGKRILFRPEVTVDRIADWYRVLDLFVAPQRWEGFGLTPLEAMACGVPVLATDVGAFSEIVTSPELGRVVPPDDIPALTRAAQEMLADADALARASQAVRAHVEAHFDIEGEAQALVALYRRLLDES
ncbi:mannosyltransferase [Cribrihabitans marinus]|uniref:Mannosyltransferase n=1 Tax=Cribrihabitans marinus TaxID=1227549 RepID=A0A1H7C9M3_9RHOB|nr:glycosyltransferase family 4 protein [Cribrihabitans marinus]GGH33315.1 glycosyl transferase family 1 [Cribrihabitans marinus]SEJ82345.1 mannosyltransferase [Cribrihabitans marinus]